MAIAILSIIIVGLSQILNLSSKALNNGLTLTGGWSKARVVLSSFSSDVIRGVFRPDLQNFPNSSATLPSFTFYTRSAGSVPNARPVSLVTYQLSASNSQVGYLLRSLGAVSWGSSSTLLFGNPLTAVAGGVSRPVPPDLLAKDIVDLEIVFIKADGTTMLASKYVPPTTPNPIVFGSNPIVMIGIAVAVVDDRTMTILTMPGQSYFDHLQTDMENVVSGGSSPFASPSCTQYSIKALWDNSFTQSFYGAFPKPLGEGLQTFERFVACTPFN